MNFAYYTKQIARGPGAAEDLPEEEAYDLFCAMLDGGVPDLELGALLMALRQKPESVGELLGFHRAASARLYSLQPPKGGLRPVVIPAYGGARNEPNLLPLLGLLLRRLRVPVLFHGLLEGSGRVASVYILRELGVMPSATIAQAQAALDEELIAYLPIAALSPGLANLLALRYRLGPRNSAHLVAKLLDPFSGAGAVLVGASSGHLLERFAGFLTASGMCALLLASTEGEPIANCCRRPRIEWFCEGRGEILFEEEGHSVRAISGLPPSTEAQPTARWISQALAGEVPIPHPIVNQLACCLYIAGYTEDMNQAKAIAAVEAGSLAPGSRRRATPTRGSRALLR